MKCVAIDIGNVLCQVNFYSFISTACDLLDVASGDVNTFLYRMQKLNDIGVLDIRHQLRDFFGVKSPSLIKLLCDEWDKTVVPHNQIISNFVNLHKSSPIEIALLSNIGPEHKILMPEMLGTLFNISTKFFSCDVGARKPTYLYYRTFLEMYPQFRGALYIDDRLENLEVGQAFGLVPLHFALDLSINDLEEKLNRINKLLIK